MTLPGTSGALVEGPAPSSPAPLITLEEIAAHLEGARLRIDASSHREEVPWEREIELARAVRQEAGWIVREVMRDVRRGRPIESENVKRLVSRMVDSIFHIQDALSSLTRLKGFDEYTFVHSLNVCVLCLTLGRHLNFCREELEQIGIGALLHDTGKMMVPESILKKRGPLTSAEFAEVKKHPLYSLEILERTQGIPEQAKAVALQHHERYDGSGYPFGLRGDEIGCFGQVAAIVDVYDAITTDRCYRRGIPPHEGMRTLYRAAGRDFERGLVEGFIQCMGIYPVGTPVRLNTDEIGVVCSVNPEKLLRPRVRLIFKEGRIRHPEPVEVDLMEKLEGGRWFKRTILEPLDPRTWNRGPNPLLPE